MDLEINVVPLSHTMAASQVTSFPACQCPLFLLKYSGGKMKLSLLSFYQWLPTYGWNSVMRLRIWLDLFMHPVFKGEGLIFLLWPGIYRDSGPKIKSKCLFVLRQKHLWSHPHFCRWICPMSGHSFWLQPPFCRAHQYILNYLHPWGLQLSVGSSLPDFYFLVCFKNISSPHWQIPVLV